MSERQDEDGRRIERCLAGDLVAFDELTLAYQDRVYNLALRLTGNAEDALDVAQDTFLKAYQSIERFRGASRFYTWLYRIAVNTVMSRRRRSAVRPRTVALQTRRENGHPSLPPDPRQDDPADQAARSDEAALLTAAIAELDEDQRVMVVLRDIEGRSYEEIAEALDCPRGTVKSRLHRARLCLKERLAPLLDDGEGAAT